jgi:uncharacterized protein (DUF362 family)
MNRRKFLGSTAFLASSVVIAGSAPLVSRAFSVTEFPDLVAVKGDDYFEMVKMAIRESGGIHRFVPEGSSVGILVNSRFEHKGAMVNPEITLALVDLLMGTQPKEIIFLQLIDSIYWEGCDHSYLLEGFLPVISQVENNAFPSVFNEQDFMIIEQIPDAKCLKQVEVIKKLMDVDVFINVPLIKHHGLTLITGALKNMMGVSTRKTNVSFHLGSGEKNDPGYLGQCIADLNLIRKPDLIVADATELIINNGPSGPGDTIKPDTLYVSTDPVAIDSFGCKIMDLMPEDIHSIVCAYEAGLGEMDLNKINILEISNL